MENRRLQSLSAKVSDGSATEAELTEYLQWYRSEAYSGDWDGDRLGSREEKQNRLLRAISKRIGHRTTVRSIRRRITYAAAVAVCMLVFGWIALHRSQIADNADTVDIRPGTNKATLTLPDGRAIVLDEAQAGIITRNEEIIYQNGTALVQTPAGADGNTPPVQLTLSTPPGGIYQVTLPDGTRVWLNAASSLKYPPRFTGNSRIVELTGEGYFEVAEDRNAPFRVIYNGQQTEVLSTAFNISAYSDNTHTVTTLVSGAVKVSRSENDREALLLRPGEQALFGSGVFRKDPADVLLATSWKDGNFYFRNTPLKGMMSQFARWYDIEIVYVGQVPEETFSGAMSRELTLQAVLNFLKDSGIDFKIKGKQLFVYSK